MGEEGGGGGRGPPNIEGLVSLKVRIGVSFLVPPPVRSAVNEVGRS